jgi:DNA/RNA endonuclease G (NUC1)
MVAFLFPNEKVDPKQLAKYIVPVADLEVKAGVDFSPAIPENLKALEAVAAKYEDWF